MLENYEVSKLSYSSITYWYSYGTTFSWQSFGNGN